jgi:hypothetical protein
MKKILYSTMVIALFFMLSACNAPKQLSEEPSETPQSTQGGSGSFSGAKTNPSSENKGTVKPEDISVTQYFYTNSFKTTYVFLTAKNNSQITAKISINLKTYDSEGNILASKDAAEEAIGAGCETILTYLLDEPFSDAKFEVKAEKDTYYESVIQDLTCKSTSGKNKEILEVTNNGTDAAEYVRAHMLFFSGEELVYSNTTYFTDDDSEIKPGETMTKEISCSKNYDSYKVFFTGRK